MPTISQLPPAGAASAEDELPISQDGTARAITVGELLAPTQPAIILDSGLLLGRVSLGSGAPEPVAVGVGIGLSGGTLIADGLDHAAFPLASSLSVSSDIVVSNQGTPMRMQASLLRGLFSAGENIAIDLDGVISNTAVASSSGAIAVAGSINSLQVVTGLLSEDLVAVNHAGKDCAIAYSSLLNGVTIDQAEAAGPVSNSDAMWAAQSSNVMVRQTFSAIWGWIAGNLPTYKLPVVELTASTNLDTDVHNDRILVFSQPVTLGPPTIQIESGFRCTLINASAGNVTLGTGFVSSSGSLVLTPWQCATVWCISYSAGTIAFASMPTATPATAAPAQVANLAG